MPLQCSLSIIQFSGIDHSSLCVFDERFSSWSNFALSGDVWGCLELGWGWGAKAREAANHPIVQRAVPRARIHLTSNVNSAEGQRPWFICCFFILSLCLTLSSHMHPKKAEICSGLWFAQCFISGPQNKAQAMTSTQKITDRWLNEWMHEWMKGFKPWTCPFLASGAWEHCFTGPSFSCLTYEMESWRCLVYYSHCADWMRKTLLRLWTASLVSGKPSIPRSS